MYSPLAAVRKTTFSEYQQWVEGPYVPADIADSAHIHASERPMFSLDTIREDGYRDYAYHAEHKEEKVKAQKIKL